MKRNLICALLSIFILLTTLTITSCKEDDPSAAETNLNRLTAHNWNLIKVTVDGVDKTSLFTGLALQWNKNQTFGVTSGGVIWPSSGTWSFTDGSGKTLFVSLNSIGDAEVTIETLNNTSLIISLHWDETTLGHGRVRSVEGDHVFEFEAAD
jgi:hypothetical protein